MSIEYLIANKLNTAPLEALAQEVLADKGLVSALLTGPRDRQPDSVTQVQVKPVLLRGEHKYQFTFFKNRKVLHRNLNPEETQTELVALLSAQFKQGVFQTTAGAVYVTLNKRHEVAVRRETPVHDLTSVSHSPLLSPSSVSSSACSPVDLRHDRQKNHILPEGKPIAFLVRLGIMAEDGKIIAAKRDKFRQINRFLEMVADVTAPLEERLQQTERAGQAPPTPLRIVDLGCGKAYLTFALYYYLHVLRGMNISLVGVDLKEDVLAQCTILARDLGYNGLEFVVGDIQSFELSTQNDLLGFSIAYSQVDMVVALHACDTATDDALVKAVAWNARVILAVPCCQHELFNKIENPVFEPMLRHGIIRERLASLITDTVRAELLMTRGYGVQMLEFVEAEHTPKNILIRAVKQEGNKLKDDSKQESRKQEGRKQEDNGQDAKTVAAQQSYEKLRDFWHIQPYLEQALTQAMPNKIKD